MANEESNKIWKHVQTTAQIKIVPSEKEMIDIVQWEDATETKKMNIILVGEMISEARKYTRFPRLWVG